MKRILVIQLLRIGDVLQTTPALAGLRERNPDSHIAALVRKAFAEPLLNNQAVDEVISWDTDSLLTELFDKRLPLAENYGPVQTFIHDLLAREFDAVINLTNDFISALITYSLDAKEVVGLSYRSDGSLRINGNWIKYLFLTPGNRRYNRYNVVDAFANACGAKETGRALSFPTKQEDDDFATAFLREAGAIKEREEGASKDKPLIGLQPGASKVFKRWPVERFAELGDRLAREHNAEVILFGSPGEVNLGEGIQDRMNERVINAIGKTSLGQLAALLKRCDMLITNDTGTMHVAAAVGVRTLVLSFGPVFSFETGPYGEGHFVLEPAIVCFPCPPDGPCDSLGCRELLTVSAVLRAFETAQSDTPPKGEDVLEELKGLTLYRSFLDPRLRRLNFAPVNRSRRAQDKYSVETLKDMYAEFWQRMCNEGMVYPPSDLMVRTLAASRPFFADKLTACCSTRNAESSRTLTEHIRDFKDVETLAEEGVHLAEQILSTEDTKEDDRHRVKSLAENLEQVEKRLEDAPETVRFLTSHFLNETAFISNLPPEAIAVGHLKLFHNLKSHIRLFISNLSACDAEAGLTLIESHSKADSVGRSTVATSCRLAGQTLSLCMIVKDEAENLPACLDSAKGAVDEIIVVDTGSSDQTVSIAEGYGARVYHYGWNRDFSAAKNECLRHATGNWILNMDADERISDDNRRLLRELIQDGDAIAFDVNIRSPLDASAEPEIHIGQYPRLFRNLPGIEYEGQIHEQIMPSLNRLGGTVKECRLVIEHLGYAADGDKKREKYQRNLLLLQQQVANDPNNAFAHYTLASIYDLMGDNEQAIRHCEKAIDVINERKGRYDPTGVAKVHFLLAKKLMKKNALDRAEQSLREARALSPQTSEIYSNLGAISVRWKDYDQAYDYFSEASKLDPTNDRIKRILARLLTCHPKETCKLAAGSRAY